MRVVVTRKIPGDGVVMLKNGGYEVIVGEQDHAMERGALLEFIKGADGILTQLQDKVDEEFLNAAGPQLKVVANFAVGFNNFDLEALKKHGVVGTNTPDVLTEAVAEHTWALIFAVTRRIVEADIIAHKQNSEFGPEVLLGMELKGKCLGVLGLGRIGSRVAEIGRALGMGVIYYDLHQNPDFEAHVGAFYKGNPEDVLREADVISVHVPLIDSTKHLINKERLAMMKPTAYLINTSRGPVIDEPALAEALKNKTIAGAGLDVLENEPKMASGLETVMNAVITPHIASATLESRSGMGELAAKNIIAGLSNQPPLTPVK